MASPQWGRAASLRSVDPEIREIKPEIHMSQTERNETVQRLFFSFLSFPAWIASRSGQCTSVADPASTLSESVHSYRTTHECFFYTAKTYANISNDMTGMAIESVKY